MFDLIKASGTRLVPGDVRAGENKEEEKKTKNRNLNHKLY